MLQPLREEYLSIEADPDHIDQSKDEDRNDICCEELEVQCSNCRTDSDLKEYTMGSALGFTMP